jgi:hypothetical protein
MQFMHEHQTTTLISILSAIIGGTYKAITLQISIISLSATCSVIYYAFLSALVGLIARALWNKIFNKKQKKENEE